MNYNNNKGPKHEENVKGQENQKGHPKGGDVKEHIPKKDDEDRDCCS